MAGPTYEVKYNGFVFPNPRVTFTESPLWDDAGIAQTGTRIVFTVTGAVSGKDVATFISSVGNMRCDLTQPRKPFHVLWDGNALFSFDDISDDVSWGPHPGDLTIEKFAGGRSAIYAWSCAVEVKQCFGPQCSIVNRPSDVLATTRRWTFEVDQNGFTRRTVSGKLLVTATGAASGAVADSYRYLITPTLPINFERASQSFVQSEDGRELSFSVTDQEVMWTAPQPITKAKASWMVRVSEYGARVDYQLSGRFEAPANVGKAAILNAIFSLAAAKFPIATPGVALIFEDRELVEDVYGNSINFRISAWGAGANTSSSASGYNWYTGEPTLVIVPPGSTGQAQKTNPYGGAGNVTSGVMGGTPSVYDACTPTTNTTQGTFPSQSYDYSPGSPNTPGDPYQSNNFGTSAQHLANPFVAVHEQWSYSIDNKQKVFSPKVAGKPNIIQQTSVPVLRLIQAGYYKQVAKSANSLAPPPAPAFGSNGAIELADVTPATPEPIGGTSFNLWTVRWRYVMVYGNPLRNANLTDVQPAFPANPILVGNNSNGGNLPQLPAVAVIPS